ncbi:siderophore-interacting protein [Salinibacterium sp. SYSU T00001]|uniref:siderophore-interacting protein n=1 Tax=Homoserinimonas sedimenticola TaxID=2986805 RepID=UPI0022369C7C|nr:siderophore-interacting protein [Salinibacterium sedimenticola]MCW4385919.1 siderophore-interacting protein [Salinibacterium sedimenticola]
MTTTTTARPSTSAFATRVAAITRLTPHFTRVTLEGDELCHFGTDGHDQRIKLVLPLPGDRYSDFGLFDDPGDDRMSWVRRWRELPDADRNPIRTYSVRAVRPELSQIDVDFVLHGTEGPASAWADAAAIGDPLIIVGPDSRGEASGRGIEWKPGTATNVLLAGDETAVPAICSIIERLGEHMSGLALIEVPTAADAVPVTTASGVEVRWLARDDNPHGALLTSAVEEWGRARAGTPRVDEELALMPDGIVWDAPTGVGEEYAWLAGESSVITGIRRHLVRDLGVDRTSVAFMGYWRKGRAEGS